ncbi:MAG: hypothetical protein ACFE9S_00720 [Candidatus Hermodarchaeota archaeon]
MQKKKIAFLVLLISLLGINLVSSGNAAEPQWFPEAGITINYRLTNSMTLTDNSRADSNLFNLYEFSGYWVVVPTYMDDNFPTKPASMVLNTSSVEVIVQVEYTEKSSTELYRNMRILVADRIFTEIYFFFILYRETVTYAMRQFHLASDTYFVDKNNFFTSDSGSFIDYIDNSLGPGAEIVGVSLYDLTIITVTSTDIIATTSSTYENNTYVAGLNGKVKSYSLTSFDLSMLSIGYKRIDYTFNVIDQGSSGGGGIPGYEFSIILGVIGILTVILIKRKNIKKIK